MTRKSSVQKFTDSAGEFELEVFDVVKDLKNVIVTAHGNGVRRWDGEKFYYQVAEHFADCAVLLVDQNQPEGDGVRLNDFQVLVSRVQQQLDYAKQNYKNVPIWVVSHSMGCPITCALDLSGVAGVIFVAPAVGAPEQTMIERYGSDIVEGKTVLTSEGLTKVIPKSYYDSIRGLVWEEEYKKLVDKYSPVHVFESGDDEIVGDGRFAHRSIPFTSYEVIEGAKHNFQNEFSKELFTKINKILQKN